MPKQQGTEFKRRKLMVDTKLQTKFMVVVSLLIAVIIVGQIAALYIFTDKEITGSVVSAIRDAKNTRDLIKDSLWWIGLVTLALGVGAGAYLMLYFTHKVAGPIYRFSKTFDEVAKGNLGVRIRFRDGDEFQELAQQFSNTVEELESKVVRAQKAADAAAVELSRKKPNIAKAKSSLKAVKAVLDKFYN